MHEIAHLLQRLQKYLPRETQELRDTNPKLAHDSEVLKRFYMNQGVSVKCSFGTGLGATLKMLTKKSTSPPIAARYTHHTYRGDNKAYTRLHNKKKVARFRNVVEDEQGKSIYIVTHADHSDPKERDFTEYKKVATQVVFTYDFLNFFFLDTRWERV